MPSTKKLPFPTLVNELSFPESSFSSQSDFVQSMEQLLLVVRRLNGQYGFAMQLGCSDSLMDIVCFGSTTFKEWLYDKTNQSSKERDVKSQIRLLLSKTPRIETGYAGFKED